MGSARRRPSHCGGRGWAVRRDAAGIDNPTYLAISADGRTLYATSEVLGWNEGTITACCWFRGQAVKRCRQVNAF
jgi:hypothetical protein